MANKPNLNIGGFVDAGPATGKPSSEKKNEVLGNDRYDRAEVPGTTNATSPGTVPAGPGYKG